MRILFEFENGLEINEEFLSNHTNLLKEKEEERTKGKKPSLQSLINHFIQIKISFKEENFKKLSEEQKIKITEEEQKIYKNSLFKKLYNSLIIEENGDDYNIKSTSNGLLNMVLSREEEVSYNDAHEELTMKTVLLNLCSIIENTYSSIYRDFYLNKDRSTIFNQKTLSYEDLIRLDSHNKSNNLIDDVKEFLVEKELENIFYKPFKQWVAHVDELLNLCNFSKGKFDYSFDFIHDMYLIRNLHTHNDGIINDRFLERTYNFKGLEKGVKFTLEEKFINECFEHIRNFMYIKIVGYYVSKYRSDMEDNFNILNDFLLKYLDSNLKAVPELFDIFIKSKRVNEEIKNVALINKNIWAYHNNDKITLEELGNLDMFENEEFELARQIILNTESDITYNLIEHHINEIEEDWFCAMYDWPLMDIARKNVEVVKLLNDKLVSIIESD